MNIIEYVPLAIRTEKPLPILQRMSHSCMGLITEIGEVVTELKRMAIYSKPLDEQRKTHILEEIGDVMWYVAIMWNVLDANLEEFISAPKFVPPTDPEGMYEATSMVLGKQCGQICAVTEDVTMSQDINEDNFTDLSNATHMIYVALQLLAEHCGSSIEQAMNDNIAKLRVRFPDAYSNEAAEGRADKNGLDARNS